MSTPLNLIVYRNQAINYILNSRNQTLGRIPAGVSVTLGEITTITGTVTDASGIYTFQLLSSGVVINDVTITVNDPNPLNPPVISCASAAIQNGVQTVTSAAGSIAVQLAATNSGSNWTGAFPSGLSINSYGLISGTLGPGTYNLTAQASNYAWSQNSYTNGPTQTALFAFTLVVIPALPVVFITGYDFGGNYTVGDDMPNSAVFGVQDYAKPVTWSASGLPDGVTINPTTGYLTGKMTTTGTYNVTVSAQNNTGTGTFAQIIVVEPELNAPVVSLAAEQPGYAGQAVDSKIQRQLTFTVGAAATIYLDATYNPISWNATDLPSGLAIDTNTGVVSGLLRVPGSYRFFVTANNTVGVSNTLPVTVTATGVAQSFQFVSDDPTLSDVQIDIRSGTVSFGRTTAFKAGDTAKFALIWLDYGLPVEPPTDIKLGFLVSEQYGTSSILSTPNLVTVAESGGQPAYMLATIKLTGTDLKKELQNLIDNAASPLALTVMSDIRWEKGGVQMSSSTFTFTIEPPVTIV